MVSHSVACHTAEVRIPPLPPAEAGTQFSDADPGGMQGWVDLCYVKADRPGIEPATCKSQVQRPTAKLLFENSQNNNNSGAKYMQAWHSRALITNDFLFVFCFTSTFQYDFVLCPKFLTVAWQLNERHKEIDFCWFMFTRLA